MVKKLLETYPTRLCLRVYSCCLCDRKITYGQGYHDGGSGRRAHTMCAMEEGRCGECGSREHSIPYCDNLG
jgi:hypothetical protein